MTERSRRPHRSWLLSVLVLAMLAMPLVPARGEETPPDPKKLKKSWLVPGACPFCDWGAQCGCTPQ
jgi:hypothetical protein